MKPLTAIIQFGIRRCLAKSGDRGVRRAENISYVHLPIADSRPIAAQRFDEIMQAIAVAVRRGNLLVHCVGGISRSPIMVAAWMHRCGYTGIERALVEVSEPNLESRLQGCPPKL